MSTSGMNTMVCMSTKPDPLISPSQSHPPSRGTISLVRLASFALSLSVSPLHYPNLSPPPCWSSSIVGAAFVLLCSSFCCAPRMMLRCVSVCPTGSVCCVLCVSSSRCLSVCRSLSSRHMLCRSLVVCHSPSGAGDFSVGSCFSCVCILFWFCCSVAVGRC